MAFRLPPQTPRPVSVSWPLRAEDIPKDATIAELEQSLAAIKQFGASPSEDLAEALRIYLVCRAVAMARRKEEG